MAPDAGIYDSSAVAASFLTNVHVKAAKVRARAGGRARAWPRRVLGALRSFTRFAGAAARLAAPRRRARRPRGGPSRHHWAAQHA